MTHPDAPGPPTPERRDPIVVALSLAMREIAEQRAAERAPLPPAPLLEAFVELARSAIRADREASEH